MWKSMAKTQSHQAVLSRINQTAVDASHVILQCAGRREACQRVCGIHLGYLDVFRLHGLLHPQVLGLDVCQTSGSVTKQHGLACGCVHQGHRQLSPRISCSTFSNPGMRATPQTELCSSASPAAERDHWLPSTPVLHEVDADLQHAPRCATSGSWHH